MKRSEETTIDVRTDEWRSTGVFLIALFVGAGVLVAGWGVWDLLTSDVAQAAFATAITSIGYGLTALLVLLGLGGLAYSASFLMKSMAPMHLSKGVQEHGGLFRSDGIVITLPDGFQELPAGTQKEIIAALIEVQREVSGKPKYREKWAKALEASDRLPVVLFTEEKLARLRGILGRWSRQRGWPAGRVLLASLEALVSDCAKWEWEELST